MSSQSQSRTNLSKKQQDDQNLLNKIMNDYDSHSDEDDVVPLIMNQPPSNREIFDSLQKRNDSVFSSATHSESSAAIVTRREDNDDDDTNISTYDTYKKVNWKDAILSHFCLRCGLFFTIGLFIGLSIFFSLWFAI